MGVTWDPALALGHPDIDAQHREIFRRFAVLVDAMDGGAPAEIDVLLDFLGDYAVRHFSAEEKVMAAVRYPGATVHAAAHARFVREYRELRALHEENGGSRAVHVKARIWIEDWLRAHILGVDLALARYLRTS
jgi:hemerythrin-like metal-binding protein